MGIKYKNRDGTPLEVKNLTKEIEMFIPRNPRESDNSSVPRHFINPEDNETLIFFKFHVFYHDSGFHIRLKPAEQKIFTGYLKHGRRPTVEKYDTRFRIPDFSSCIEKGNCSFVDEFLVCMNLQDSFTGSGDAGHCGVIPHVAFNMTFLDNGSMTCDSFIDFLYCPPPLCEKKNCSSLNCSCIPRNTICSGKEHFLACHNVSETRYQNCSSFLWPNLFYGKYKSCQKDPYRYFYGPPKFNKAGWYYVGVRYWNGSQDKVFPLTTTTKAPTTLSTAPPTNYTGTQHTTKRTTSRTTKRNTGHTTKRTTSHTTKRTTQRTTKKETTTRKWWRRDRRALSKDSMLTMTRLPITASTASPTTNTRTLHTTQHTTHRATTIRGQQWRKKRSLQDSTTMTRVPKTLQTIPTAGNTTMPRTTEHILTKGQWQGPRRKKRSVEDSIPKR